MPLTPILRSVLLCYLNLLPHELSMINHRKFACWTEVWPPKCKEGRKRSFGSTSDQILPFRDGWAAEHSNYWRWSQALWSTDQVQDFGWIEDRLIIFPIIRLWGLDAQKRLRAAKVLVVGMGGLGCEVIMTFVNDVSSWVSNMTILNRRPVVGDFTHPAFSFRSPKTLF